MRQDIRIPLQVRDLDSTEHPACAPPHLLRPRRENDVEHRIERRIADPAKDARRVTQYTGEASSRKTASTGSTAPAPAATSAAPAEFRAAISGAASCSINSGIPTLTQ